MYDYVIIGSGLFGSVFAHEVKKLGKKCLVLDKRQHIGGNCYTLKKNDIHVHAYGPHIFHTSSKRIWEYVNGHAEFNHFVNRPKVSYKNKLYSFPINLFTLYQLWGVQTPEEAKNKLEEVRIKKEKCDNLEDWILSQVGAEIYEKFIYGYTKKQWGKEPKELPSFIIKRLPIRLTMDDNYFEDEYQGIPKKGYTELFNSLLDGIEVDLDVDYFNHREKYDNMAKKIVYTGAIDEFFNYQLGELEWRSLRFQHTDLNIPYFQGTAIVNHTDENCPYTRIIEHKHFNFVKSENTTITMEYPQNWDRSKEKFYPVNDVKNNELYKRYRDLVDDNKYIFGGRLADYKYYDMHQVIGSAIVAAQKEMS
jgi:UDP-galactopyranose mutase